MVVSKPFYNRIIQGFKILTIKIKIYGQQEKTKKRQLAPPGEKMVYQTMEKNKL